MHAVDDPLARRASRDEVVQRARAASRSARGRHPAVETVHDAAHSDPPSSAAVVAEHDDRVAVGAGAARGGTVVELVDQADDADDRRRVDVARRGDSL